MQAPTYNLEPESSNGTHYLDDVAELVEDVLEKGKLLRPLTSAYGQFVAQTTGAEPTSHEESLLDLLMLGVLWRTRGHESTTQQPSQRNLVVELVRERRQGLDKRRDGSQNHLLSFEAPFEPGALDPRLSDLFRLNEWLLATGEYDDEVKRLDGWLRFFENRSYRIETTLQLIVAVASDFEVRANNRLGKYTTRVNRFLAEQLPLRKEREDAAQCSRRRLEYHLNMVGAELLNRAWQKEFLACKEQVVVLPGCLRAKADDRCRAVRTETELHCTHCSNECLVSRATRVAARCGKPTVAVIHGSDFSRFLKAAMARGESTGIVGVACAPGILGAGFRAKALGLPAQCVLLDASGCNHWQTQSSASSFDLEELQRLLLGRCRKLAHSLDPVA